VSAFDGPGFGFASRSFYASFLAARHVLKHSADYFPTNQGPAASSPTSEARRHARNRREAARCFASRRAGGERESGRRRSSRGRCCSVRL
jgi:hypothetical protein